MGTNKALLSLNGKPMIQVIAEIMQTVFSSVIIIADEQEEYGFLNIPIIPDKISECGPLGGIYSAITFTQKPCFVVACDVPFISPPLIEYIINFPGDSDVKIPEMDSQIHPLCGWYSMRCTGIFEAQLAQRELKLQNALQKTRTVIIPISPHLPFYHPNLLLNINDVPTYENVVDTQILTNQNSPN